jgi:hypothetical protein
MNIEKIEALKKERINILLEIQEEKENKNDNEILKSLKNKYHSISNKINYHNNHDKIREHKKEKNKKYQTEEAKAKQREYMKQYHQKIMNVYNEFKKMI